MARIGQRANIYAVLLYVTLCTAGFIVISYSAGTRSKCTAKSTLPLVMNQGNLSICIQITTNQLMKTSVVSLLRSSFLKH